MPNDVQLEIVQEEEQDGLHFELEAISEASKQGEQEEAQRYVDMLESIIQEQSKIRLSRPTALESFNSQLKLTDKSNK